MSKLKKFLIGSPISSEEEQHQRLSKKIALPVFASDAISSTAYATDEILVVLLMGAGVGAAAFKPLLPIAIVVCVLLVIVVLSYRQTIMAYPSGGGAYIVSRENLGAVPALIAGSSLLVDYILTVAVSVAGGVLAIRTATGLDRSWAVPLCLICVFVMTVMNLRGVKESGAAFAGPTYFYIVMLVILIVTGFYRIFVQQVGPLPEYLLSEEAIEHLAEQGYDKKMGARPLARKIDELVRVPLSKKILFERISNANVMANLENGEITYVITPKQTAHVGEDGIIPTIPTPDEDED
jgi:hypothetical protein